MDSYHFCATHYNRVCYFISNINILKFLSMPIFSWLRVNIVQLSKNIWVVVSLTKGYHQTLLTKKKILNFCTYKPILYKLICLCLCFICKSIITINFIFTRLSSWILCSSIFLSQILFHKYNLHRNKLKKYYLKLLIGKLRFRLVRVILLWTLHSLNKYYCPNDSKTSTVINTYWNFCTISLAVIIRW